MNQTITGTPPPRLLDRLIVVLGPTASGKSALSIALAEKLGGEILVCDSTQIYRHFDIGTAKVAPGGAHTKNEAAGAHKIIDPGRARETIDPRGARISSNPSREQKNIPHHLIDLVEPADIFTAGDYRRHALLALDDLRRRGKLPILAAGTGLYLRALLEGLADAPQRSEELRERLRRSAKTRGAEHLHKILARLDPASAARIAPRDSQKIIRAIEMRLLAGKPVAEIFSAGRGRVRDEARGTSQEEGSSAARSEARGEAHGDVRDELSAAAGGETRDMARGGVLKGANTASRARVRENALEGYAVTKIGLLPPRAALYARIDARVREMLAAGWLDEVRSLVASGVPENVKPFQFIGYADLRAHLEGRVTLAEAVARIQQSTRRFAKRQLTWFRREPDVHWLEGFGDAPETIASALNFLARRS